MWVTSVSYVSHIQTVLCVSGSNRSTGVTHFQPWFLPLGSLYASFYGYYCINFRTWPTNSTPFQFIDSNKLNNHRMALTNHTLPISHHITPLVNNGIGGRHTDTYTHTYRCTNKNNFKKPTARAWLEK